MKLIRIYQCFCDETRLRILHLLGTRPLCVCHIQSILGLSQVQVSKHLAYLRKQELVLAARHENWMVYSLPEKRSPELEKNLKCLQDCASSEPVLRADLLKLKKLTPYPAWIKKSTPFACCSSPKQKKENVV